MWKCITVIVIVFTAAYVAQTIDGSQAIATYVIGVVTGAIIHDIVKLKGRGRS